MDKAIMFCLRALMAISIFLLIYVGIGIFIEVNLHVVFYGMILMLIFGVVGLLLTVIGEHIK